MSEGGLFYQAFIYLSAAVVAVPVAKKLGLGSVLGYLLAGVAIGPFVLGLIGEEGQDVMHFAEFGVVMMLFLVGLELQPSLLWKLRIPVMGLGGLQVGLTTLAGLVIVLGATDLPWQTALAIGLTLALSSTAIVIQTLNEKGMLKTVGGQNSFSVLLFQDIAVIPILALFPMLAVLEVVPNGAGGHGGHTWIDGFSFLARTGIILGVVGLIIGAGKYMISPAFKLIAKAHTRELFTAGALLLVIGTTLLMTLIGLSPALGTFLAGVVLAQSEYRHELETDIEPFKGLLLGLFFIAVGASIDFDLIASKPLLITELVVVLVSVKFLVLVVVGKLFGMKLENNLLFSFGLAQGGEFAFVLFSFALHNGVMSVDVVNPLVASVAISMALTPLLSVLNEKVIMPRFATRDQVEERNDEIETECPVIIAGFGRYGSTIGRFLQGHGIQATYLDIDPDNVDLLRKLGLKVFYGDASRHDLLHAAGAEEAKLLIVAVDNSQKSLEIVKVARKYYPHLKIVCRTQSEEESYNVLDEGVEGAYRDYLDSALRMAADVLGIMGMRKYSVERSMHMFRRRDEAMMHSLREYRHHKDEYIRSSKMRIEDLEKKMREDTHSIGVYRDQGWETDTLSEEFTPIVEAIKENEPS